MTESTYPRIKQGMMLEIDLVFFDENVNKRNKEYDLFIVTQTGIKLNNFLREETEIYQISQQRYTTRYSYVINSWLDNGSAKVIHDI